MKIKKKLKSINYSTKMKRSLLSLYFYISCTNTQYYTNIKKKKN